MIGEVFFVMQVLSSEISLALLNTSYTVSCIIKYFGAELYILPNKLDLASHRGFYWLLSFPMVGDKWKKGWQLKA